MTNTSAKRLLLLACGLTLAAGCRAKTDPTRAAFESGMQAYLARRGDLCVGRPRWPIDVPVDAVGIADAIDRKSTRLISSHVAISYAVFCLTKKKQSKTGWPATTRITNRSSWTRIKRRI